MPLQNLLGDLNLEGTQNELLSQATLLLCAILEKMPRVDGNDRLIIGNETTQTVAIAAAQTLATVTTLTTASDLTRLNNFGTSGATSRPADAVPLHMSNAGSMHIYNNIIVS